MVFHSWLLLFNRITSNYVALASSKLIPSKWHEDIDASLVALVYLAGSMNSFYAIRAFLKVVTKINKRLSISKPLGLSS